MVRLRDYRALVLALPAISIACLLSSCERATTKVTRLTLNAFPDCATHVRVTIQQEGEPSPRSLEIPLQHGKGSTEAASPIRWDHNVWIALQVTGAPESSTCAETSLDDALVYSGNTRDDKEIGGNSVTLPYNRFIHVRHVRLPGEAVPGTASLYLSAEGRVDGMTCWQQWENRQLSWRSQLGSFASIGKGTESRDRNNVPFVFGQFGREMTQPPVHCLRQCPIPGEDMRSGAGAQPYVEVNVDNAASFVFYRAAILQAARTQPELPLVIRHSFDTRTILWSEEPTPHVLGYYSWQVIEDVAIDTPSQARIISYEIQGPEWTTGTAGLEPVMLQH